jgi:hypothetical protein
MAGGIGIQSRGVALDCGLYAAHVPIHGERRLRYLLRLATDSLDLADAGALIRSSTLRIMGGEPTVIQNQYKITRFYF